ncbi:GLPGLI family protein [Chryseobacterium ginsenosidimutans]|uniref:GLPGLI family protein n=1 Tax=Chryseobacterium ginsenosidimutans TaxID=687846 RepID=UPI0027861DAC|nr:GLPGLI family protein [Chryseobacterium ginsenosidimutans]MDQ0592374.1 GLPGLI family protein [Chryseobacterium ginsenosidimutans]
MKGKLLGFFVFLLVAMSYGQTVRYVYETSVNPDSINLVSMKVEKTFLDIKGNHSLFISESKLIKDSLFSSFKPDEKKENKKEGKGFPKSGARKQIEPTFFEYFITKNISEQKVYYDRVGGKQIYYQEDRPVKWEISNISEKQNGYATQKATTSFGGRIWTAWFTKDINISDGPYKFSGLPGLIVKLEDENGDYRFDLVKKMIIQNAFEEPISSEAKQSTRINFHGDKAALELEVNKIRKSMAGNNGEGMQDFGGGRQGGGMRGGGGHGGSGMHRGGMRMDGGNNSFPMQNSGNTNVLFNGGIQNPIELK